MDKQVKFHTLIVTFMVLGVLLSGSYLEVYPVRASADLNWQYSGIQMPAHSAGYCLDGANPDTLLVAELTNELTQLGTFAYNLNTGTRTRVSSLLVTICDENGLLFSLDSQRSKIYGFTVAEPDGWPVAHMPDYIAKDGSHRVYSLDVAPLTGSFIKPTDRSHLWGSDDGGRTWQERAQNLPGTFVSMAMSPTDARSIYLLSRTLIPGKGWYCQIYFSTDGGLTWEKRQEYLFQSENPSPSIGAFSTNTAPVTAMLRTSINSPTHEGPAYNYSLDGARSFSEYDYECTYDCGPAYYSTKYKKQLWYGTHSLMEVARDPNSATFYLYNLQDPAHPQRLNLPVGAMSESVTVVPNSPANLFVFDTYNSDKSQQLGAWYSPDEGQNWQALPDTMQSYLISPYAPLMLVGLKADKVYTLKLPQGDRSLTGRVSPANGSDSNYYDLTGHNLSGIFKKYWLDHGGLAQFGYPHTEPFREVNPSDGKVYTVQYFERNRFEYHPEFAGTPYEVELGLLGNQLTADRRSKGEGAFNHFDDLHYPGGTYFELTGHNLRNSFKTYWEKNGGLAIYGYPTSEEFYEVNPDDGQTYVVQYFERNRFEYHPEYKGTQYEVLLGLLGNTLLKNKDWL